MSSRSSSRSSSVASHEYQGDPEGALVIELQHAEALEEVRHVVRLALGRGNFEELGSKSLYPAFLIGDLKELGVGGKLDKESLLKRPDFIVLKTLHYSDNEQDRRDAKGLPDITKYAQRYAAAKGFDQIDWHLQERRSQNTIYNYKALCKDKHWQLKRWACAFQQIRLALPLAKGLALIIASFV